MIYCTNTFSADPSVLREALFGCLSVDSWPGANTAGHLQLPQTKERDTCPWRALLSRSILTTETSRVGANWSLYSRESQTLSSEELSVAIKTQLQWGNWPGSGCTNMLLALTSYSFKSQCDHLVLISCGYITLGFGVVMDVSFNFGFWNCYYDAIFIYVF